MESNRIIFHSKKDLSKLKVLYIDPTQGTGGATKSLLSIIKSLDKSRIESFLLQHMEGPDNKDFIHYGVCILPQKINLVKAVMFDPYFGMRCTNIVCKKSIKIFGMIIKYLNLFSVILHDYFRILNAAIIHHVDIIHFNSYRQIYLYLSFICMFLDIYVIFHIRSRTKPPPAVYRMFSRICSFIFVSKFVGNYFLSGGIETKFNAVIYDGRFPDEFKPLHLSTKIAKDFKFLHSIPLNHKVVINISTLTRGKGQHTFIKAANLVSRVMENVTFLIVGDNVLYEDDIKSELSALIAEHHLEDRVLLLGNRSDIAKLLLLSDLSVVATELPEALCGVNIEAMAAGVPVVSTNIGAIPEVVIQEETGLLVPPGDHKEMAQAILRLLNNREEARKLVEKAHQRFLNVFNAKINTAHMIDFYRIITS